MKRWVWVVCSLIGGQWYLFLCKCSVSDVAVVMMHRMNPLIQLLLIILFYILCAMTVCRHRVNYSIICLCTCVVCVVCVSIVSIDYQHPNILTHPKCVWCNNYSYEPTSQLVCCIYLYKKVDSDYHITTATSAKEQWWTQRVGVWIHLSCAVTYFPSIPFLIASIRCTIHG